MQSSSERRAQAEAERKWERKVKEDLRRDLSVERFKWRESFFLESKKERKNSNARNLQPRESSRCVWCGRAIDLQFSFYWVILVWCGFLLHLCLLLCLSAAQVRVQELRFGFVNNLICFNLSIFTGLFASTFKWHLKRVNIQFCILPCLLPGNDPSVIQQIRSNYSQYNM